jgi:hypothetical protein
MKKVKCYKCKEEALIWFGMNQTPMCGDCLRKALVKLKILKKKKTPK